MPADITNANGRENIPPPLAEFEGYAQSGLFSDSAKISITENELIISSVFDQLVLPYSGITSFGLDNYRVCVNAGQLSVCFSRMGQQAEWLYDKLFAAYNGAVLRALKVSGNCLFEADGSFKLKEKASELTESGNIRLYSDCICLLPPGENARRLPLCFIKGMEKGDYSITVILSEDERYTLFKMGRELERFEQLFILSMRKLRESTSAWHRELAPKLPALQLSMAAKLMPYGTAASLGELNRSAPELAQRLEEEIIRSRISKTYLWLKALCTDDSLTVGAKPAPTKDECREELSPEEACPAEEPLPIIWAAAPDEKKRIAAVETALANDEAAATYLYYIKGEWRDFALQIDRALESSDLERRLITLSEQKLSLPENADAKMLIRRTPSLQLLRTCFAGRAIHSSQERWLKDIKKYCGDSHYTKETVNTAKSFCTRCGNKLDPKMSFCGQCGAKIN